MTCKNQVLIIFDWKCVNSFIFTIYAMFMLFTCYLFSIAMIMYDFTTYHSLFELGCHFCAEFSHMRNVQMFCGMFTWYFRTISTLRNSAASFYLKLINSLETYKFMYLDGISQLREILILVAEFQRCTFRICWIFKNKNDTHGFEAAFEWWCYTYCLMSIIIAM